MLLKRSFVLWCCLLFPVLNQVVRADEVMPLLRVLFQEDDPPFLYKTVVGNDSSDLRGHGFAATDWVLKYAKYRYKWDTFPAYPFAEEYTKPVPSNWTGDRIGTFKTTDFDVLVTEFGFVVGSDRLGESTAIETLTMSMVMPYPEEKTKIWSFAYPFTATVWVCMLMSAVLVGSVAKAMNLQLAPDETFDSPFAFMFQVIIGQGGSCSSPKFSLRLLAATWSVAALILSNVYLSLLVAFFSSPYRVPVAESLEQVLNNKIVPMVVRNSFEEAIFQEAPKDSIYHRIYEKSQESVVCTNSNYTTTCVEWLVENKYAVMFMAHADGEIWYEDLVSRNSCRLTSMDLQGMPTSFGGTYMMPKGHPSFKNVSLGMLRLNEYGLRTPMKMHENDYQTCTCCNWKQDRPPLSKLGLKDLAGIFGLLGVGYCTALLVFLLELLIARKHRHGRGGKLAA